MSQINNSFESGGMSLAFNEIQFAAFVQFLKQEVQGSLPIRKAACTVGQQPCNAVWVMGRDVHIDENGDVMVPDQSAYIWFDKGIVAETGKVPLVDLLPKITLPLSSDILSRLVSLLRVATKHNFVSSLLVVAGGIMSLHYSTITNQFGGCPIVVARGPAETGKSTALRSAFSILGMMTLL